MNIVHWIIFIIAILVFLAGAAFMMHQVMTGLGKTSLNDKYVWGVNIQGFYFFSALGIGILLAIAIASIFYGYYYDSSYYRMPASVAFGSLVSAQLLMGSDLGKPKRAMKILFGKKFFSPLFLDFAILSLLTIAAFFYMFGIFMWVDWFFRIWVWAVFFGGIFALVIHVLLFVPRVGPGYQSEPFNGVIVMGTSLWIGSALMVILTFHPLFFLFFEIASGFVCVAAFGSVLSDKLSGKKPHNLIFFVLSLIVAIIVFANGFILVDSNVFAVIACIIAIGATYFEKSQTIIHLQKRPVLPEPYSQFERRFLYKPVMSEWLILISGIALVVVAVYVVQIIRMYIIPLLEQFMFFRWIFG